jgi:hypothetical protein
MFAKTPKTMLQTSGSKALTPAGDAIAKYAVRGWELKQQIDKLKGELDDINARLIEAVEPGTTILVDDTCQVPVASRETIKVTDPAALSAALGERYPDLVSESVSYKLSDKLKALAADADDPIGRQVAAALSISQSVTVSYRGGKPLPKAA